MSSSPARLFQAVIVALFVAGAGPAFASDIPKWLKPHVGVGEGKIAPVVLDRARALYQRRVAEGAVRNPCYLAMDATRPSTSASGGLGQRFYVICEEWRSFRAVYSGYGDGRKLKAANFSNGRECAQNFSNAEGSNLTMGGEYLTAESRTSFKGYYDDAGVRTPFHRTFLLFDGVGETENARERAIGGHVAKFLKWQCRFRNPDSPHADEDGYTPYGRLVNYTGGRSNGCTTWSDAVSDEILSLVEGNPTTLYIYPEGRDIDAVASAVRSRGSLADTGLYWNAQCLGKIGAPTFWPKATLQPVINRWRDGLPKSTGWKLPICK